MTLNDFLYSNFEFSEDEDLQKFKFKMINLIFLIISFSSALFAVLSDLGINDLGPIHSKVNYAYSVFTFCLIFFLRLSKENYTKAANALLIASLLTFTSALNLVPQDEFRMIWFYLLVFVAYILNGSTNGLVFTLASIVIILCSHFISDLQLSQTAINSGVLGLIIGSSLSRVYTNKINDYENSLKEKNAVLEVFASTDGLTGIMNKRVFNELSQHYFERAQRHNEDVSLLILDLDFFKRINDRYGHSVGDFLLIRFVKSIQTLLRKSDIFARIGGEEFSVLLFKTASQDALNLAEKIRLAIEQIYFTHESMRVSITTSIGISQNKATDTSFKDLFSRADKALYEAKENGRNKIFIIN